MSKIGEKWAFILWTLFFWETATLLENAKISHQRQFWFKKKMMEKKAERLFYIVKKFNFSYLLLSDDKKAFLKNYQNIKNLAFAFSQGMKIDENKSF